MTVIKLVPLVELRKNREPLTGGDVLQEVETYIGRFVAYPSDHARVAHTLWIAHAHLMGCWESTPRLALLSAERGSGKTRALEITEPLVPNPVHAVNVTPAYLFRKVGDDESARPTILYDEVDTLFGSKVQDTGEVRGLLNAGHRRGAVAGRCVVVGQKVRTEEIPAYCAVALAGIGNLPDTIASRSIIIEMRRRAADERVEPFRPRLHCPEAAAVQDRLAKWCSEIAVAVDKAQPEMPLGIVDRDADCWEPLLAVADAAGGNWPERARAAAIVLVKGAAEKTQTTGVQLLSDLYDVFGGAEKLPTATILERLCNLPESPWADMGGKRLSDLGLASRLKKFGVKPKALRIGDNTLRGYQAADLQDPWKRYLRPTHQNPQHSQQPQRLTPTATEKAAQGSEETAPVAGVAGVAAFRGAVAVSETPPFDGDPFATLKDDSLKLKPRLDDYPDLPDFLDRRSAR